MGWDVCEGVKGDGLGFLRGSRCTRIRDIAQRIVCPSYVSVPYLVCVDLDWYTPSALIDTIQIRCNEGT